jgi:tetratricopeptide (TPR) repeat protein
VPPPDTYSKNEPGLPQSVRVLAWSIITAAILFTIGFGFVVNTQGETDPVGILSSSLLNVTVGGETTTSFGIILLLFATFAVGLIFAMEPVLRSEVPAVGIQAGGERKIRLLEAAGICTSVCFFVFLISMVIQASLITPDHDISMTVVYYYLAMLVFLLAVAYVLPRPSGFRAHITKSYAYWLYPLILLTGIWAVASFNLRFVRADIFLKAAAAFEQRQQWDGSIRFYERAIALAPNEDFYCLSYGRALFGKAASLPPGKQKDALYAKIYEIMNRAHLINPLNTDHLANLGLLYIRWAESDSSAEGRAEKLKKAHMYYELAAKGSPRKTVIMNNWSKVYAAEGNYEGAIAKLKHSLTLDDKIGATYFTLADIYMAMGRMDDAVLSYRKGTEVEPGNAEAVAALAHLYYRQGKIKEATETSLKALSIDPKLMKAHSLLGLIYYKSGRLPQAISENLEIVKVSPGDIQSHRNLAVIYEQSGQMGNAIKHMEKVIALSPESERVRLAPALEQMKARMGNVPSRNP